MREAFRLLRKSIIHVESEDVTFDDDEDDYGNEGGEQDVDGDEAMKEEMDEEERTMPQPHRGEYDPDIVATEETTIEADRDPETQEPRTKRAKKWKIEK